MPDGIHTFQIGAIRCIAINDGMRMPDMENLEGIFSGVPADELRAALEKLPHEWWNFCYNPLFIESDGTRLLVDTGHGPVAEQHGNLVKRLTEAGISPESIQVVFISHAHGDHINGLTDGNKNPIYPNARYVIGSVEWEFWMSKAADEKFPADYLANARNQLRVMENNLTMIEPGDEIIPGVTAIEAYGHTPGHLAVLVASNGEKLLHIVDTAHSLVQVIHPEWSPRFDAQQDVSPVTRRRIFQRLADENMLCYAYHFPFPALGRVTVEGAGFEWKPGD